MTKITPIADRLWRGAVCDLRTHCWNWQGSLVSGYGQLSAPAQDAPIRAHVLAYRLTYGAVPNGLFVLHHCDNRRCINPAHLYAGSAAQNSLDMLTRGREWKGKRKLTWPQVLDARARYSFRKVTTVMLAAEYGVSKEAVRRAVRGTRYRHA